LHKRRKGCKYDYDSDSDDSDDDSDADSEDEITLWKAKRKLAVHFKDSAKKKTRGREKLRKDRLKRCFSPESSAEREWPRSNKKQEPNVEEVVDGMRKLDLNKDEEASRFYTNYYMLKREAPEIISYLDRIRSAKEGEVRTYSATVTPPPTLALPPSVPAALPAGMVHGMYPLPLQAQAYANTQPPSPRYGPLRPGSAECYACNGVGHPSNSCPTMCNLFENGVIICNSNGQWAWPDGNDIVNRQGENIVQAVECVEPGSTRPRTKVGICMIDSAEEYLSKDEWDEEFDDDEYEELISTLAGQYSGMERDIDRYPVYLGVDRTACDSRSTRRTVYDKIPVPTRSGKSAERLAWYTSLREPEPTATRAEKENSLPHQVPVDATWSARFNPQNDDAIMADMSMPPLRRTGPPGICACDMTAWEARRVPV
jgi:hypothetical protein